MPPTYVALIATLIATSAAAQEPLARPAEPDIKRGATITTADYPEESLRRNEQGMTSVEYVVDETGEVKPGSCRVTATSRYDRLDVRTCTVIEKRFRFLPALANGKPVPEVRTQSIFWRLPGEMPQYDLVDVAIRMVNGYGACLVKADPALAVRIAGAPLGSKEQTAAVKAFDGSKLTCWYKGDGLTAPPMLLAGAIAEHLLEARFDGDAPLALAAEAAAPAPRNGTEALTQCVARRNPENVRTLLATTPTGPAEGNAVRRIVPDLSPCVMAGTTLRLNKVSMRALLAVALYREATAAVAAGSTGGGTRP